MPCGKKRGGGPTSLMFLSYNTNPLNVQYLNTLCFLLPHPSSHSQDLVGKGNQYKYDTTCAVNNEIFDSDSGISWILPTSIKQQQAKLLTCQLTFSIQLLSSVWHFATPWTATGQTSLSIANSQSLLKLVHWVGDAIQPSHPLSSPSPPAVNLSQHLGLFQWISSLH